MITAIYLIDRAIERVEDEITNCERSPELKARHEQALAVWLALKASLNWQPIETAPRGRAKFAALNHDGEIHIAAYAEDGRLMRRSSSAHYPMVTRYEGDRRFVVEEHEEWRNEWVLWTRLYDFTPTHWAPLPPALAAEAEPTDHFPDAGKKAAGEKLREKIAAFLKDRDEAFIMSDEQTDEERWDSADTILKLIGAAALASRAQAKPDGETLVDRLRNPTLIHVWGEENPRLDWDDTINDLHLAADTIEALRVERNRMRAAIVPQSDGGAPCA